jgi:hypothetical protein
MKKGTLVQTIAPYQGRIRFGVVLQSTRGKLKVLLDDGVSVVSAPADRFVSSDTPLPPALEPKHVVGETVVFTDEFGVEQLGVVKSVAIGSLKVVCDKGRAMVESHPGIFAKTDRRISPAPVHQAVAPYRVRSFKEQTGHGDTPAFAAVVQKNGVDAIRVIADGWGGPCECQPMDERNLRAPGEFQNAVREWCKSAGAPDHYYAVESWIEWSRNCQPYGLEAAEYLAGE